MPKLLSENSRNLLLRLKEQVQKEKMNQAEGGYKTVKEANKQIGYIMIVMGCMIELIEGLENQSPNTLGD